MAHNARHTESTVLSFHDNIKEAAKKNLAFRQTVCKGAFSELVVISVPPAGELGEGAHDDTDVIMFIVEGKGEVTFGDRKEIANKHDAILVTAGRLHNLRTIGHGDLKALCCVLSSVLRRECHRAQGRRRGCARTT